jgi:3D (Asp-Asp-Asp) domain-containing protein
MSSPVSGARAARVSATRSPEAHARLRRARLRRTRARVTIAARVLALSLTALAFVRRDHRPGALLLRHEPALVVGVAPPAAESLATSLVERTGTGATREALAAPGEPRRLRPKLFRSLIERARGGERVSVNVTAYCLKGMTRRDNRVRPGIIAADPKVFPLGRHVDLYIGARYFGRYLVDDTGKDIQGNRLDLWTESCRDARFFGRRYGVAHLVKRADDLPRQPDVGPSLR